MRCSVSKPRRGKPFGMRHDGRAASTSRAWAHQAKRTNTFSTTACPSRSGPHARIGLDGRTAAVLPTATRKCLPPPLVPSCLQPSWVVRAHCTQCTPCSPLCQQSDQKKGARPTSTTRALAGRPPPGHRTWRGGSRQPAGKPRTARPSPLSVVSPPPSRATMADSLVGGRWPPPGRLNGA